MIDFYHGSKLPPSVVKKRGGLFPLDLDSIRQEILKGYDLDTTQMIKFLRITEQWIKDKQDNNLLCFTQDYAEATDFAMKGSPFINLLTLEAQTVLDLPFEYPVSTGYVYHIRQPNQFSENLIIYCNHVPISKIKTYDEVVDYEFKAI